ncbi:hypothetical protein Tco_1027525, partial [Tanacetum coccineum]
MWLRYQVEGYTEEIVHDFEDQLETIYGRQVNRVYVLDFEGLTPEMKQDLAMRVRMVYTRDDGQEIFVSHAWRRLFEIRAPLVCEFILDFLSTCRIGLHTAEEMAEDGFEAYWLGSERVIPDKGDLSDYWIGISSDKDFLRAAPSYTYIRDPLRRLWHKLIPCNISKRGHAPKKYLFRHAEGRKSGARLLRGHFIGTLAHHFGLVSDDGLRGLSIMTHELPVIDMGELVKLNIWGAEDAPDVDEGAQAVPAPIHAPPPPPPAMGRTMPQRLGRLEEEIQGLHQDVESFSWRLAVVLIRHSMEPFEGAAQWPSRDALDRGPGTIAPPQPS